MSIHIEAEKHEIADTVLLPGDPLRAKYIAETFLENPKQYNTVRNMFGYTGTYKGKEVSVMGTGMGMPSATLYIHELIKDYDVQNLIRVGSCGALKEEVQIRDIILAQGASTDSSLIFKDFNPIYFSPIADFQLLDKAYHLTQEAGMNTVVGNIYSSDTFYTDTFADSEKLTRKLADHGVLANEMETAGLYYLAAKFNVNALSILTVSDHLITGEATSSEERETTFDDMITVALDLTAEA